MYSQIIRAGILGFGPLGENLAKQLGTDSRFELISIVDNDPSKLGKEIGTIKITNNLQEVIDNYKLDLVFITTSSLLERIKADLIKISSKEINIISSCEELIYPWISHPELSQELDKIAKTNNARILGTGINPGFLMDYLPITLASPFLKVQEINYIRNINTKFRRSSFVAKVGVGLSIEEFKTKKQEGRIGHVGFKQSVDMLTSHFKWTSQDYTEKIEPVIVNDTVEGIDQTCVCICADKKKIKLNFTATKNTQDNDLISLKLKSGESVDIEIKQGINGESGTVAMLMNSAEKLLKSQPGLKTMIDI